MKNAIDSFSMIAKTLPGLEGVLAEELTAIGARDIEPLALAVRFSGTRELLYRANYSLRTALRVLIPLHEFTTDRTSGIYEAARDVPWEKYSGPDNSIAVDAAVSSRTFTNGNFCALKVKDAVADRFKDRTGRRPGVDTENPSLRINLRIHDTSCVLSLDSSGESLHRRGYRLEKNEAPLSEVLAAGLLLLSGWKPSVPLLDPMCGSGTFLAEAGLIACGIPPGFLRKNYGFMNWRDFDPGLWKRVHDETSSRGTPSPAGIYGSDRDPAAVEISLNNLKRAGLANRVTVKRAVFEEASSPLPPGSFGHIIMNPPYGKRLHDDELNGLYKRIGDTLKHKYPGWTAWIFSSNLEAVKHIGLRSSRRIALRNGPLECRLLGFELFPHQKD